MARKRQVILLKLAEGGPGRSDDGRGGMDPLGTTREVMQNLAQFNTAPDGSGPEGMGEALGTAVLHGPGFVVEMARTPGDDRAEVSQLMVTVTDEDFAWAVLMRLCRTLRWKMMDPESGRTFG